MPAFKIIDEQAHPIQTTIEPERLKKQIEQSAGDKHSKKSPYLQSVFPEYYERKRQNTYHENISEIPLYKLKVLLAYECYVKTGLGQFSQMMYEALTPDEKERYKVQRMLRKAELDASSKL